MNLFLSGLGSIRMVKSCDLRLENAGAEGSIFKTSQPANNIYIVQALVVQTWTTLSTGQWALDNLVDSVVCLAQGRSQVGGPGCPGLPLCKPCFKETTYYRW